MLFIFVFLLLLNVASAVDEQTLGTVKTGDCVILSQNCADCSFVNVTSIVYPNSSYSVLDYSMSKSGTSYSYDCFNVTKNGKYIYNTLGDPSGTLKVQPVSFYATPNGESSSSGTATLYIGLIVVLLVFLILTIYSFVKFDNLLNRVGMIGLMYLFFLAISFIAWNMASDFLTSSPFLVDMFRILFFVLISLAVPLFIGGLVWYFLMLWKIKEIERLMEKGLPEWEAVERANRK